MLFRDRSRRSVWEKRTLSPPQPLSHVLSLDAVVMEGNGTNEDGSHVALRFNCLAGLV